MPGNITEWLQNSEIYKPTLVTVIYNHMLLNTTDIIGVMETFLNDSVLEKFYPESRLQEMALES